MSRLWRTVLWGVGLFAAYVILTRPAVAADAANAIGQGIRNAANAGAEFLDQIIPKS